MLIKSHKRTPREGVAVALMSLMLSLAVVSGPVTAQSTDPAIALPDFTQIVERTESSVVNIRTTEAVRVRERGPRGNDPYDMFRWFFGPDFMPPALPSLIGVAHRQPRKSAPYREALGPALSSAKMATS